MGTSSQWTYLNASQRIIGDEWTHLVGVGTSVRESPIAFLNPHWISCQSYQSGTAAFFVNAQLVAQLHDVPYLPTDVLTSTIGSGVGWGQSFTGSIAHVALYKQPISVARIQEHFARGRNSSCIYQAPGTEYAAALVEIMCSLMPAIAL